MLFLRASFFIVLAAAVDPLVDLGYTKYQGTKLNNGITQWLGMRYAAPPVGDLRFRAPVDPPKNLTVQSGMTVRQFFLGERFG